MKRRSHYSQHFIRNPGLVDVLLLRTTISHEDVVVDIGAGSGVLTSRLAERCAEVIAIESEPRTAQKLRENTQKHSNVTVVESDILTMPLPSGPYKVFANIPFHLSSRIVHRLIEATNRPEAIYLIVQKQFAAKLLLKEGQFTGALGVMTAPYYRARIRKRLLRTDFWPHPAVDTVFVELIGRASPLIAAEEASIFRTFVERCFHDAMYMNRSLRHLGDGALPTKPSLLTMEQWLHLFGANRRGVGVRANQRSAMR